MEKIAKIKWFALTLVFLAVPMLASRLALANDIKTLVVKKEASFEPGLAKSWTKVKDGEFEFVLDTSAELIGGKALTTGAVKESLEKALAESDGVAVESKSPEVVSVKYSGAEADFFNKLAETKIRAQSDVADTSDTDGGIRARPAGIVLQLGEVKGFVKKMRKNKPVSFKITESKLEGLKQGDEIEVNFGAVKVKKNMDLYFTPVKAADGTWTVKDGIVSR